MNKILAQLRAELRAGADAVNEAGAHHYFKLPYLNPRP